jgi:hypothetical protein
VKADGIQIRRADIRPQDRATLAWILSVYPSARRMWAQLRRLGMTRIRPDGFPWEALAPSLWIADCATRLGGMTVGLCYHGNGFEDGWSLHS